MKTGRPRKIRMRKRFQRNVFGTARRRMKNPTRIGAATMRARVRRRR